MCDRGGAACDSEASDEELTTLQIAFGVMAQSGPRCSEPVRQPAERATKLSTTRLRPALSKSMVSLLPSTSAIRP